MPATLPSGPREMTALEHRVHELVGKASMCWIPEPSTEVFDTTRALKVAEELIGLLELTSPPETEHKSLGAIHPVRVRLETASGGFVATEELGVAERMLPGVIVWGARSFVLKGLQPALAEELVYREASVYRVPMRPDEVNGPRPHASDKHGQ